MFKDRIGKEIIDFFYLLDYLIMKLVLFFIDFLCLFYDG